MFNITIDTYGFESTSSLADNFKRKAKYLQFFTDELWLEFETSKQTINASSLPLHFEKMLNENISWYIASAQSLKSSNAEQTKKGFSLQAYKENAVEKYIGVAYQSRMHNFRIDTGGFKLTLVPSDNCKEKLNIQCFEHITADYWFENIKSMLRACLCTGRKH